MNRSYVSAKGATANYLIDMVPGLLAGLALLGPTLGLGGESFDLDTLGFGANEARMTVLPLAVALGGLFFGLDRARHRGSVRLGLGVACCAFVVAFAGLQLL